MYIMVIYHYNFFMVIFMVIDKCLDYPNCFCCLKNHGVVKPHHCCVNVAMPIGESHEKLHRAAEEAHAWRAWWIDLVELIDDVLIGYWIHAFGLISLI